MPSRAPSPAPTSAYHDPEAYWTSILIDTNTGATVGFQMISPIVAQPIPFSSPFDTSTIDRTATYVAHGSMWDGTTLWEHADRHSCDHQGQPEVGRGADGRPGRDDAACRSDDTGRNWFLLLLLLAAIGIGVFLWWRSRQEPEKGRWLRRRRPDPTARHRRRAVRPPSARVGPTGGPPA